MAVLTRIETPVGTIIASSDGQSLTDYGLKGKNTSAPLWRILYGTIRCRCGRM